MSMQKNRKNLRSLDPRIEVGGKKMLDPVKMDFHLVMPSLKFGCYVSYHDGMGLKNLKATATRPPSVAEPCSTIKHVYPHELLH